MEGVGSEDRGMVCRGVLSPLPLKTNPPLEVSHPFILDARSDKFNTLEPRLHSSTVLFVLEISM